MQNSLPAEGANHTDNRHGWHGWIVPPPNPPLTDRYTDRCYSSISVWSLTAGIRPPGAMERIRSTSGALQQAASSCIHHQSSLKQNSIVRYVQ